MSIRPIVLVATLLAGCATADQHDQLVQRVDALEKKVTELEARPAAAPTGPGGAPAADSAEETAADAVLKDLATAMREGDFTTAKGKLAELDSKYANTTASKKARKLRGELDVIGKDAPASWEMEKWFQGQNDVKLDGTGTTLVVFWEVWCPHCRREVPEIENTWKELKGSGLKVVGVTKITKSATEEKVTEFLKEQKVTYPIAKEKGDLSEYFNVSGIPAAAVVKDGKIVWRGHPARLDKDQLKSWL
ncbi:MAG: redoxin domain-containing protein [Alphaproteobacteria bacterium]|nr:redoxin domain-containing protein [Alphaproteobacteria bacterium]